MSSMSRDSDLVVREGIPVRVTRLARPGALREYGIVLSFVALFLVLTFSSDAFFTQQNLLNILNQQTPTLIIAVAGTLVR
jgi:ribose transport system permease protein